MSDPAGDPGPSPEPPGRPVPAQRSEWYAEGLRFSCTQCGNCCTGPPGAVWIDEDEARAIAKRLGLSLETFYATRARRVGARWSLEERLTEHGHDCIFLDRESVPGKAVCAIYESRPRQCRTWPFWPENLRSRRAWISAAKSTPCPGMDQGRLYGVEEIRIVRRAES